jgi:raffinose/stachyose/melibiose transport system substrate-binding protein
VTITVMDAQEGTTSLTDFYSEAAAAYTRLHPNVHVEVKSITFATMLDTGSLILSGSNAPSLFEVAQTYGSMYKLAQEHLILPLSSYAAQYGWAKTTSSSLLGLDGEASPAKQLLWSGDLYGMAYTANIVGVFYNKRLLAKVGDGIPRTFSAFEKDLATAKHDGLIPLSAGGGSNTYQLGQDVSEIAGAIAPSRAAETYLYRLAAGDLGTTWTTSYVTRSAVILQDWGKSGYLSRNLLSSTETSSAAEFSSGKSLFLIDGNWESPAVQQVMGSNVGFFVLPSGSSTHGPQPVATGGEALAIPTHGPDHADAAAFMNFVVSQPGAKLLMDDADQVPVIAVPGETHHFGGVNLDITNAWLQTNFANGAMPFWGSNTPDALTQLAALSDELVSGRVTPAGFGKALQADELSFRKTMS